MGIGETNICSCSAWLSRKPRIVFGFILRWIEEWDTKNKIKQQKKKQKKSKRHIGLETLFGDQVE